MSIIEEISNLLEKHFAKRPIDTEVVEYGRYSNRKRIAHYNDAHKEYDNPITFKSTRSVNSLNAFCDFIREEFKRLNNTTGNKATVQLHIDKSYFTANDDFNENDCDYQRIPSEQLNVIKFYNGKRIDHEELIEMILKLKPSIKKYQELNNAEIEEKFEEPIAEIFDYYNTIFTQYAKLRIARNARMNTTPVYDRNGIADNSYTCTFRLTSGHGEGTDEDVKIPEGFSVAVPFVKAGEYHCKFNIDIQPLFSGDGIPYFAIKIPNFETEIEKAIIDESNKIKENLKEFTELLVLSDL